MRIGRVALVAIVATVCGLACVGTAVASPVASPATSASVRAGCGFSFGDQSFTNCQNFAHIIGVNYLNGPNPGGTPSNTMISYCIRAHHTAGVGNPAAGVATTVFNYPERRCRPSSTNAPPGDR